MTEYIIINAILLAIIIISIPLLVVYCIRDYITKHKVSTLAQAGKPIKTSPRRPTQKPMSNKDIKSLLATDTKLPSLWNM